MPEASGRRSGTVLAFDFGTKRIGIAVGETELAQAHPLTVIHGEANAERFAAIAALIREWRPATLVVGRPLALDGTPHEMTARSTRFGNQLHGRFRLPVEFADERLSSVEAGERLRAAGHSTREAKTHLDALAAQVILESYFAQISRHSPEPSTDASHAPDPTA